METINFTILLVDDHIDNLYALEAMLESKNRNFIHATSGNEALKVVLKNPSIGLIILDVQMPEMNGFEVAEILQSNPKTCEISIIFATAINKEERFVLKGYGSGAVDYLTKPLDLDITRAKVDVFERLYRKQQELKASLHENEQINQQLQRFTYVVAHDLKSPLSGIHSIMDYLQQDSAIESSRSAKDYISLCIDATNYLQGMISSILDYSKTVDWKLPKEEVDVHQLVLDLATLLYPPPNISIRIEGKLPTLYAHRLKLQQVFQNLISNAIKHQNKERGSVWIGASPTENEAFMKFWVRDDGPGISESDQAQLYKLFQTSSKTKENTGVGLNLVKMFVEEQGGIIECNSQLGVGTAFTFTWQQ